MDDLWKGGRYDFGVWKNNPNIGLIVDSDGTPGPDANIVWLMAPNQVAWTQQQAQNYCIPFLPPDAKLQKKTNLVWIYNSNLIKATVNPSGIFNITYDVETDPSLGPLGIIGCKLTGGNGSE